MIEWTGYLDKNNRPIFVGDKVVSKYGVLSQIGVYHSTEGEVMYGLTDLNPPKEGFMSMCSFNDNPGMAETVEIMDSMQEVEE